MSVRVHFDSDVPELFSIFRFFFGSFCGILALKIWRTFCLILRIFRLLLNIRQDT